MSHKRKSKVLKLKRRKLNDRNSIQKKEKLVQSTRLLPVDLLELAEEQYKEEKRTSAIFKGTHLFSKELDVKVTNERPAKRISRKHIGNLVIVPLDTKVQIRLMSGAQLRNERLGKATRVNGNTKINELALQNMRNTKNVIFTKTGKKI